MIEILLNVCIIKKMMPVCMCQSVWTTLLVFILVVAVPMKLGDRVIEYAKQKKGVSLPVYLIKPNPDNPFILDFEKCE